MQDRDFNSSLHQLRTMPLPPCPGNLESNTLRRIRLARTPTSTNWATLLGWLPRPAFAAATLSVIVISTLVTSAIALSEEPNSDGRATVARAALGFDAFGGSLHLPTD